MEIEKLLLTARERTNIDGLGCIDPHSLKRGVMRNRRNNQPPVVFKADEAAIEQVIDAGRQQQSVLAVQPFLIGRVAPWLTMTCDLSEWTTNEVPEQNTELLCRGSLHGIRCHPEQ
jgi:hypothetical protein